MDIDNCRPPKKCDWVCRGRGDRACRVREVQARVRFGFVAGAEIVRVECAKCRRDCDLDLSGATLCGDRACRGTRSAGESATCPGRGTTLCGDRACRVREVQARVRLDPVRGNPLRSGATLCGDRACRGREVQARVRFGPVRGNPLRRSCVSSAGNTGESAFWIGRAPLLEEVSYATRVLESWRFTFGGSLVGIYLSTPTHPHIGEAISHLRVHIVTPSHPPSPSFFVHIFSLNSLNCIQRSWLWDVI